MKINIEVREDDGSLIESAGCGSFESAEETLGKMERRYQDEQKSPIREAYEENEDHDCHLVGGGGESGCEHPSHKETLLI